MKYHLNVASLSKKLIQLEKNNESCSKSSNFETIKNESVLTDFVHSEAKHMEKVEFYQFCPINERIVISYH